MSEQLREALQGLVDLRGHGSWSKKWDEAWDAAYAALSNAAPGAPQQEASGDAVRAHLQWCQTCSDSDVLCPEAERIASRAAATAPAGGVTPGAYLRKKAEDYAMEYGSDDMGGLSFGSGAHAEVKMDHYNNLLELADELDALTTAARAAEPAQRVIGSIHIDSTGHPYARLTHAYDANGNGWTEGTQLIAASPTPPTKDT